MAYGMYHKDANQDGLIDLNELRNFAIFQHADRNHDGRINPQEFVQSIAPQLGINPAQNRAVFQAADLNHDGVLSREELNYIADFKRADLNHDGRVDPHEMQIYNGRGRFGIGPAPPPHDRPVRPPNRRPVAPSFGPAQNNHSSYQYSHTSSYTKY